MDRRIAGFHQDAERHWVADLECGHECSVRHDPPWESRRWVLTPRGRSDHIGTLLPCRACDFRLSPEDELQFQALFDVGLEWYQSLSPEDAAKLDEASAWCGTPGLRDSDRPSYEPWSGQGLQVLLTRAVAQAIAQRALAETMHGELVVNVTITAGGGFTATIAASPTVPPSVREIAERAFATVTSAPTAVAQAAYLLRY